MADVTNVRRYRRDGLTSTQLTGQMTPGATVTVAPLAPMATTDVTITCDNSVATNMAAECDAAASSEGYSFVGANPVAPAGIGIRQIGRAQLAADASAVTPSAWTDVLTVTLTTSAASLLKIDGSCNAGVLIGGAMRLLINGGAYSNVTLATSTYPILAGNAPGQAVVYLDALAAGTYTIKIQAAASVLGSVIPRAGSSLVVTEYA